jgi:shikimate kinase
MKNNIALIGFMAAGKTVVGQSLATNLQMDFLDLDTFIEKKAGKSIPEIFATEGEMGFRILEMQAVKEAFRRSHLVVACGGGVILNRQNTDIMIRSSVVVYLVAEPEEIFERIKSGHVRRPLLEVDDPLETIERLLKQRKALYEKSADITVDTTGLSINAVVRQIISELGKDESFNFQKHRTG